MNCLYIVPDDPISRNYSGGGSTIYYDQLLALNRIGCKVTILHYASQKKRSEFIEFYKNNPSEMDVIRRNSEEIVYLNYSINKNIAFKLRNKVFSLTGGMRSAMHLTYLPVFKEIEKLSKSRNIDFIWAQHFLPASIAVNVKNVPVVYMHHDWIYRIKALKSNTPEDAIHKAREIDVCKFSSAVVSGSYTEFTDIYKLGVLKSFYIPSAYPIQTNIQYAEIPDIVHLGGMNTTANRIGLDNFINKVWGSLNLPKDRLKIIGNLDGASNTLSESIKSFSWLGFVSDLSKVMRKGDIHIVPWHENTGTRTRVPLVLSYGQVLLAVAASVRCFPELKNRHNCILVSTLDEMGDAILNIMKDGELRRKISDNAIEDFKKYFVEEGLEIRYSSVVESISKKG